MAGAAHDPDRFASPSQGRYRADIDGLRAFAVSSVVAFHGGLPGVSGGFIGVDVFFVISGFLLGGIVHREIGAGRFSFARFYVRRARRILPALIATALMTLALGLLLLGPGECTRLAASVAAALLGVSNLWFLHTTDYFTQDAQFEPFLMTWSLGIEEQFYVLLPIALLLARRYGHRPLLWAVGVVLGSLLLGIWATATRPVEAFYLLPTRAWELGVGVVLAMAQAHGMALSRRAQRWVAPVGLTALAAGVLLLSERDRFPGWAALLPTIATAMLIATPTSAVNRRLLASRPAVAVGLVSYSWYLLHWPLIALARICSATALPVWLTCAVGFGAIVPALAMWRWVERPFRRPSRVRGDGATLLRYGASAIACVAGALGIVAAAGLPGRVGPLGDRVERTLSRSHGGPCLAGYGVAEPNASPACAPSGRGPAIALLGDSHAAALGDALRAQGRTDGFDVLQFTAASCPPLLGATLTMRRHPGAAEACAAFNTAAIDRVADDPRVRLVIVTAFWQSTFGSKAIAAGERVIDADPRFAGRSGSAEMTIALRRTLLRLRGAGKAVLVLGDVPWLRFDPARHAWQALLPLRAAVGGDARAGLGTADTVSRRFVEPLDNRAERIVAGAVSTVSGVAMGSLSGILCDARRCRTSAGGVPLFIDVQHLSFPGAALVLRDPRIAARLAAAGREGVGRP